MYFKLTILLFALAYGSARNSDNAGKLIVHFPEDENENIRNAILTCGPAHNIEPSNAFEIITQGTYLETRDFQEFIYCVFRTSNQLRDDDGHVDADRIVLFFPEEANLADVIYGCSAEESDEPAETTYKFFKCFQDTSRVLIEFL